MGGSQDIAPGKGSAKENDHAEKSHGAEYPTQR